MKSGVIIAGGRSTRFGDTDKTVADLAGVPMIRRVADRIAGVVDDLVVNCRPEQTDSIRAAMEGYPLPVAYAEDEVPDRGPVAGIYNGLGSASGRNAFLLACDMPLVDPALASFLFERVGSGSAEAAVPRLESGWFQTTQAVYRVDAMRRACETALEEENPRILAPLEQLDYAIVEESELRTITSLETFENVNTQAELEATETRLSSE